MTATPARAAPPDPTAGLAVLAECSRPHLIGVRHHSPALAGAMPELLAAVAPEVIAVELPTEATDWIEWLAHPEAEAPLALALASDHGGIAFYPFADFSPELAALRWARAHDVPVECIDLPVAAGGSRNTGPDTSPDTTAESEPQAVPGVPEFTDRLARRAVSTDLADTWDRLVEAYAPTSTPEQIRRAALAHGWATRQGEPVPDAFTLARETHMRDRLADLAERRVVAVVGSFHTPALLPGDHPRVEVPVDPTPPAASLVGYSFAQLDSRSGYGAGIRDPRWQQTVFEAGGDAAAIRSAATELMTAIAREVRAEGHPAGPAEAAEAVRIALDLATLRGLGAPSRRELVEALTTVFAQGSVLGRGRPVARAAERILVGNRRGQVAPGTPEPALLGRIERLLSELKLPAAPGDEARTVRVESLRGNLDRRRHIAFWQLQTAGIVYAAPEATEATRGADPIGVEWRVAFTPATVASIGLAALHGATLEQAVTAILFDRLRSWPDDPELPVLEHLIRTAGECGATGPLERALDIVAADVVTRLGFAAAVSLHKVLSDLLSDRVPAADDLPPALLNRVAEVRAETLSAAVRELAGIMGSDQTTDVHALVELATMAEHRPVSLTAALAQMRATGSPLMQGAAEGLLAAGDRTTAAWQARIGSWLDLATDATGRRNLRHRLGGFLLATAGLGGSGPAFDSVIDRVERLTDERFLACLPSLRGAFDILGPAQREGFLAEVGYRHQGVAFELDIPPEQLAATAAADQAARERLAALGLRDAHFSPPERWRLVLGKQSGRLSAEGGRAATALDELYGAGDSPDRLGPGGAGRGPAHLRTRNWVDDVQALFGDEQCQEIIGQATETGRADLLEYLDPNRARPSVELASTILSLAGGMSEARLAALRPLLRRIIDELSRELATRVRPALSGITTPRPTRRRTARLDLDRTIRANLAHIVQFEGRPQIVPDQPVFIQPGAQHSDWHIVVVVDVSGSMERSTVFSALTAAVLAGVRTLRVSFLAFNTEVIDLSEHVSDPLSLLLEVSIGGGTNIANAVAHAGTLVKVPARTAVIVVSDFEESGPLGALTAQIDSLHRAGVRLLGCAALDDTGTGVYNVGVAQACAAAGMRVAALTPLQLAQWVGGVLAV